MKDLEVLMTMPQPLPSTTRRMSMSLAEALGRPLVTITLQSSTTRPDKNNGLPVMMERKHSVTLPPELRLMVRVSM
jgi:hypothetical protein